MRRFALFLLALGLACTSFALDSRLKGSFREDKNGWVYLHLHGSPRTIGFQHGYWAEPEIAEVVHMNAVRVKEDFHASYQESKDLVHRMWWHKIPREYQEELSGIVEGARARGANVDIDDMLYHNGWWEIGYYFDALSHPAKPREDHCSAFIATGSETKDGKIVMGHSCWTDYLQGAHCNFMLDILPARGHHILMDSEPGYIHSGDDFAINDAGLMMTETTISGYVGYKTRGTPEFVRMRRSIQYGSSIDDAVRELENDNNGGYANMWLMGDTKTNEIAELDLALKNVAFHRSLDGCFTGANTPIDSKIAAEECPGWKQMGAKNFCLDRTHRWDQLMAANKGKVDLELGEAMLADHVDSETGKEGPSMSTLCGHGEEDGRKLFGDTFGQPYIPIGAVQAKVVTSDLAKSMSFWARMGHPCGTPIVAANILAAHPDLAWERPFLHDMPTEPWTLFRG